jgi:hypothetical protein
MSPLNLNARLALWRAARVGSERSKLTHGLLRDLTWIVKENPQSLSVRCVDRARKRVREYLDQFSSTGDKATSSEERQAWRDLLFALEIEACLRMMSDMQEN